MMSKVQATARAGANIAFVKYWGNRDDTLRLPLTNSLSMTLDTAETITTVIFDPNLPEDELVLNERVITGEALTRVSQHLDRLRQLKGLRWRARVISRNTFPTGAGIASSASAFAALTVAAAAALGLDLSPRELSLWARLGSGSAARSIFGGYVELQTATRHEDAWAYPVAPPEHWRLADVIAVVSRSHKAVGSTGGHRLAHTSPLNFGRLAHVHTALAQARSAILARDLEMLGEIVEQDALAMHAVMMTSRPSLLYWEPGTVAVMHAVRRWRSEGVPAYFTIDAGPNVHIITEPRYVPAVVSRLQDMPSVQDVLVCHTGPGARVVDAAESGL